jgi:hypothetical protein
MFFKIKQALVGFTLFLIASTLAQCKNLSSNGQTYVTIATSAHLDRKNNTKSSSSSDSEDVSAVTVTITAAKPQDGYALRVSGKRSGIIPMHEATPFDGFQQESAANPVIVPGPLAIAADKVNSTKTFDFNQYIRYSAAYGASVPTSRPHIVPRVASSANIHGVSSSSSVAANPTSVASSPQQENSIIIPPYTPPITRHLHECFWSLEQIGAVMRAHEQVETSSRVEAYKHSSEAFRLTKVALRRRGVDGTVGTMVMKGRDLHFEMRVRQTLH